MLFELSESEVKMYFCSTRKFVRIYGINEFRVTDDTLINFLKLIT